MILLGPEIVLNGGFENHATEPQSWINNKPSGSSLFVVSSYPFAGDNHAVFDVVNSGFNYSIKNTPYCTTALGEEYFLQAAIAPETGSYLNVNVWVGGYLQMNEDFLPVTTAIPSWHLYSWSFECTKAGSSFSFSFLFGPYALNSTNPRKALFDGISLRQKVNISAEYKYKNGQVLDRIISRTIGGSLRVYTGPSAYRRFDVPFSWVSSKNANTINSWWETGEELVFVENNDYPNSFYNVRIVNNKQPFNQHQRAHFGEFLKGTLNMETV